MEYGFASHLVLWSIVALSAVGLVATLGATWAMVKGAAYKD
ncbi:hypothetical protein ABXJ56_00525 [Microbacterium chocolatum]